jgi:predicted amidophosphoribosyltransferase
MNAAALRYEGPVADAIRRFKYAGRSSMARPLAAFLVQAALPYTGLVDVVVPVPLHPRKLRDRGWNPSLLLARPVAEVLGAELRPSWLKRVRATRVQAGLCRSDRQRNVAGAFRAKAVPSTRVLLIAIGHDVTTLALAWAPDAPAN